MIDFGKYKISIELSIRDAVKHMDELGMRFCVCVDTDENVVGVISDGDFRHAVHNGVQLDENVIKIMNKDYYYLEKNYDNSEVDHIFNSTIVQCIPILEKGKLIGVILIDEFYNKAHDEKKRTLDCPVVIMAGGKGTRLDPFTRILPKPLIPIGDDPVIKLIMDEFNKFGMDNFSLSLNNKARMIRAYFHDNELGYKIKYIHENIPLGTAGALKYLEKELNEDFFVSNCDVIIRADYGAFYDFHMQGDFAISLIGSMRQYTIPYGVCEIDNGGLLKAMREKPRYDFLVNTGMYLLSSSVLKYIPENKYFDMTDLIKEVQRSHLKVGIFPVSEKSWIDVGELSEYKDIVNKFSHRNF